MNNFYQFILKTSFIIIILSFWNSCNDEINFELNENLLEFSKDTVYLDTVFTNIGSSTYNLKVYNIGGSEAVSIESLAKKVVSTLKSSSLIKTALPKNKDQLIQKYIPDITRIYNDFGLEPYFDLQSSILKTANFHRESVL